MVTKRSVRTLAGVVCLVLWSVPTFAQQAEWERHIQAGHVAYQQGNYAKAVKELESALSIAEAFEPDDPRLAASLGNLAAIYLSQGRYDKAEPLAKRALAIAEKTLGPEHPDVATGLDNLAVLYDHQGRYAEAEPLNKRALAIYEKTLGPEHPDAAQSLNNLAVRYYHQGRYAEAEPLLKRAVAIYEKTLGPTHPQLAESLDNLATLYSDQGRYAEAEPLNKRALAIYEKTLGPEHPDVATSLNNLALLYHDQGRYAEAEPLYKRALAIKEKKLGLQHPSIAASLESYAALLRKTGRTFEAEKLEARATAERAKETAASDTAASASELEKNFTVGEPTSNLITVGKKQVMLPPGEWVIAGVYATRNNSGISMLQLFLIDAKAGVLKRASLIEANIESPMVFRDRKAYPVCSHKGFLHLVTNSAVEGEECWWVNHWSMTMPPKRESAWSRALEYARREGIEFPTNCVAVGYRLANDSDFLHLSYCFNPEADGIVPPGRIPQNPSIWHVDRFDKDPKRAKYVDRLKHWGVNWLPQVRAGFKGELKND